MVIFSRDGRRCDERCYNAKWTACRCVCGGKNHGMGLKHAQAHNTFGGRTFEELATDEMRKDALMDVDGAFEVHGTRSGRLDPTKQNESATPKSVDEDDRSLGAWSDFILERNK